jgi:hypothetical protein
MYVYHEVMVEGGYMTSIPITLNQSKNVYPPNDNSEAVEDRKRMLTRARRRSHCVVPFD